jgi:predicted ATP-dependent endonuclease of OLD family
MPRIESFTLRNFKGAADVTIDISKRIDCPVVTLIGLNESGKTTILEGLSYFITGDNAVTSLFGSPRSISTITALIPVHRKAAFTDETRISAAITLDNDDYKVASELARRYKLKVSENSFPKSVVASRTYKFEDSVFNDVSNYWNFQFNVSPLNGIKERQYERPTIDGEPDLWLEIVKNIESRLPRISYFPTFLVDMPARIYLREHEDERAVNRYYRFVFQDILDSLGGNLSLEKHVCNRIAEFRSKEKSPDWFSIFFGGPSKSPIDSVFQKISNAITKEVLGGWHRIFQRPVAAKSIFVEWNIDTQKGDLPYATLVVSDGESRYALNERSLGFRWFFSFLLFTAFKKGAERSTLFAFDEPAANLHAKAQAELLTSFSRIISAGNRVIYSTHSHHMINPRWLAGAFIVENAALDYDSEDVFGLTTIPTNIKATSYRNFVSQYPTRTSYYQPVIEKLEYVVPELIGSAPFVIVEGITDYYALKFVERIVGKLDLFSLIPGSGAAASGPLISFLISRGEKFLILLDDDKSGRRAALRYYDEWYLAKEAVKTLGELHPKFSTKRLEGLISSDTKAAIAAKIQSERAPTKKEIGLFFAEMCATEADGAYLSQETIENLSAVLILLRKCFERT